VTTVLVVDESSSHRRLLHTLLSVNGHDVVEADGSRQAVDIARRAAPAVVITDVTDSGEGGDTVRRLREDPNTAAIPVVLYTSRGDEPELRRVAEAYDVERVVDRTTDPEPLLKAVESVTAARTGGQGHAGGQPPDAARTLRLVLDLAPVGAVLLSGAGHASYVNPSLERITGASAGSLLGTGWLNHLSARGRPDLLDALKTAGKTTRSPGDGAGWRCRDRVNRPGGRTRWLDLSLHAYDETVPEPQFVAFVVDVTAAVEGERRASGQHAESADTRLGSVRRLAGGVAHGYNNALAVILSYAEFLRERIGEAQGHGRMDRPTGHELLQDVETILAAGRRAAHLTRLLQSFDQRGKPPTSTVIDLNAALQPELTALRERLAEAGVGLRTDLAPDLRPVVADSGQVGQILRYLIDNACDAMTGGGILTVETSASAQDHVRLTVRDTGPGMTPNVAQRATEPFFTTKPEGEGAGLGLTAVEGIVSQAGGELLIETEPGTGTAVHVLFPVAAPTGEHLPAPSAAPAGVTETIVVVDDEQPVRSLVHRILTRAGYGVITAANAAEALTLTRSHPGPVHCLITDLAMPGLPGTELTRRLRAERPELAVLYMSGYAEPFLHHVGNADDRTNLLPKPFSRADLLTAVRATIQEHRAARPR
jgi:PAS domain S-box-containing protein